MNKYLLHSTFICVFSEAAVLYGQKSVDIKLFYFILPINFFLLLYKQQRLYFPKYFGYIFLFLTLSLLYSVTFLYNSVEKGSLQLAGISFVSLYFYNIIRYFSEKGAYLFLIKTYLQYCYWMCVIGLVLFVVIFGILGHREYRLHGILSEPAHFAGIILPSFFIMMKYRRFTTTKFYVTLFALLLTISSIGYLGILVGLFLYQDHKFAIRNIFVLGFITLAGISAYTFVENFRTRVDDTFNSYSTNDVGDANFSTYALLSNLYITERVFEQYPALGAGIGSHPESHKRYIDKLPGYDKIVEESESLSNLNAEDANSLFLRVVSELGIVGAFFVFFFIFKNYSKKNASASIISRAVLLYFIYKLFREGNYFPPEMYFFVFIYYFNRVVNFTVEDFNTSVLKPLAQKKLASALIE